MAEQHLAAGLCLVARKMAKSWHQGYKTFSMLSSLSMKFYLLINRKLLITTVVCLLILAQYEIFSAYEYENADISWHFQIHQQRKKFYILRAWTAARCCAMAGSLAAAG